MISSGQLTICDVCRLVDYDCTKKFCAYCGLCDAFICAECQPKWAKRLLAAAKRKLEYGYKGIPNYEEVASEGTKNEPSANLGTNA